MSTSVKVKVSRYVDDEPQPGIVECVLVDALGQSHVFIEKTAVVSRAPISHASSYPMDGELACEVEAEWSDKGESLLRVCTELPWGIASVAGETRFVVHSSQLLKAGPDV